MAGLLCTVADGRKKNKNVTLVLSTDVTSSNDEQIFQYDYKERRVINFFLSEYLLYISEKYEKIAFFM
jgi:hypothetical protein